MEDVPELVTDVVRAADDDDRATGSRINTKRRADFPPDDPNVPLPGEEESEVVYDRTPDEAGSGDVENFEKRSSVSCISSVGKGRSPE